MVDEPLLGAFEKVDISVEYVDYGGHRVPLETGRLIVHAVRDYNDHMTALCGRATRYILPSGKHWDDTSEHLPRCEACLQLHPL
jgi:hypothetical protein